MRTNGAMTVRETTTGETYEVVDYVDELLRARMDDLTKGSTVRLELSPVADCTNVRRVTRLRPGGLPEPGL